MKSKQQLLDEVKEDIIADNVCPDLAKTATQLVFGTGNPDADIIFIGEAPGKQEDIQGKPFVGASGKFLDEMLQSIHLNRDKIYITNIVKYRPPNNRDPLPQEKEEFLPYLERQLNVIDPKIIVTLGRHSTNVFLPDMQISQIHGQPQCIGLGDWVIDNRAKVSKEIIILPLYHPAAALYNGGMRQTLTDDFSRIPAIINLIKEDNQGIINEPTK